MSLSLSLYGNGPIDLHRIHPKCIAIAIAIAIAVWKRAVKRHVDTIEVFLNQRLCQQFGKIFPIILCDGIMNKDMNKLIQ